MTAAIRARRSFRWGVVLGMTLAIGLVPPARAADPPPDNRLESPMDDLAVLPPTEGGSPDATPDLLVLGVTPPSEASVRLAVLRRSAAWDAIAETRIGLDRDDLPDRWLVDLGERHYALLATSSTSEPGAGTTVIVALEARDVGTAPAIVETGRIGVDSAVEYAGAADVDGSGIPRLVLGLRPRFDASGSCGSSEIRVIERSDLDFLSGFSVPGRMGAGAVGRWDDVPGDDLLAYASPECPPAGAGGTRLVALRLADGTGSTIARMEPDVTSYPAPLRVRLDGRDRDQGVVWTPAGLALVDGVRREPVLLTDGPSFPLVAGLVRDEAPAMRMAWIDGTGLHAQLVRPGRGGPTVTDRTDVTPADADPDRWDLLYRATAEDITRHGQSSAWLGSLSRPDCPDLILPGAIMPCDATELRPGAAWLATRLVAAMPIEGRPGVLVAAGLGWDPRVGLPATPSPEAAGPDGRWRHGPSTPFALSEVRATDVGYFAEYPVPKATLERTAASDGITILPGFTGTRMFVSVTPLAEGQEGPDVAPSRLDGFRDGPGSDGMVGTVRVPVPAGNESGRDGSFATLPLGDVLLPDATRPGRWSVRVIPVNDWGEVGFPIVGTVARDITGPTVNMDVPFTTPVWPFLTDLPGRTEPGSTIRLEGVGDMPIDDRGRFRVETRLAPWPQTLRLTATDASGNASTTEFSVIGGVDYRRFPWALITAIVLLAIVAARGLRAAGRRMDGVEATPWSTGLLDDASRPEIEDLPAGGGLGPRR